MNLFVGKKNLLIIIGNRFNGLFFLHLIP